MLLKINPETPNPTKIDLAIAELKKGKVIVIPTDTVYSFACDIQHPKAIQKITRLKGIRQKKAHFSLICHDLSQISDYTRQFDRTTFKHLNNNLPGPYTFILPANKQVSRIFDFNKKEIGIRIPDNLITRDLVIKLGRPLVVASVHHEDKVLDYITDPSEIFRKYKNRVAAVIDGGIGDNQPSTVIDISNGEPEAIREGKGEMIF